MFAMPIRYPGDSGYMRGYMSLEFKEEIKVGEIRMTALYRICNNNWYLKPCNLMRPWDRFFKFCILILSEKTETQ